MQLMEAIVTRRATRKFRDEPVPQERIECSIQAANLAPSSMNRQPWAFAVLADADRIADYGERARQWLLQILPENAETAGLLHLLRDSDYALFHGAPVLVLILATSAGQQAAEDCCLAGQNFMLAACDEGLGTCWIGLARPWLNLPAIKSELKIPENYHVVAPIILGYPAGPPEMHERNPVEIHWLE
jgi:nitroreductase